MVWPDEDEPELEILAPVRCRDSVSRRSTFSRGLMTSCVPVFDLPAYTSNLSGLGSRSASIILLSSWLRAIAADDGVAMSSAVQYRKAIAGGFHSPVSAPAVPGRNRSVVESSARRNIKRSTKLDRGVLAGRDSGTT